MKLKIAVISIAAFLLGCSAVRADVFNPFSYSASGIILYGGVTWTIIMVVMNFIIDLVVLSLILHYIKFPVARNWKKVTAASFYGMLGGLAADFFATFFTVFAIGLIMMIFPSSFYFFVHYGSIFAISFCLLYLIYKKISTSYLKLSAKDAMKVGILMALITNPVWMSFVTMGITHDYANRRRSIGVVEFDESKSYCEDEMIHTFVRNEGNVPINASSVTISGTAADGTNIERAACGRPNREVLPNEPFECIMIPGAKGTNAVVIQGSRNTVRGSVYCA